MAERGSFGRGTAPAIGRSSVGASRGFSGERGLSSVISSGPRVSLNSGIGATRVRSIEGRLPIRPISLSRNAGGERTGAASFDRSRLTNISVIPSRPRVAGGSEFIRSLGEFKSSASPTREGPARAENLRNTVVFSTIPDRKGASSGVSSTRSDKSVDPQRRFITPTINNLAEQARKTSERNLPETVRQVGKESIRIVPDIRTQPPVNPENKPPITPTRFAPLEVSGPRQVDIPARTQRTSEAISRIQENLRQEATSHASKIEPRPTGISEISSLANTEAQAALQRALTISTAQQAKPQSAAAEAKILLLKKLRQREDAKTAQSGGTKDKRPDNSKEKDNETDKVTFRPLRTWGYVQSSDSLQEFTNVYWEIRLPGGKRKLIYTPRQARLQGRATQEHPGQLPVGSEDPEEQRKKKKTNVQEKIADVAQPEPEQKPLVRTALVTQYSTSPEPQSQLQRITYPEAQQQHAVQIKLRIDSQAAIAPSRKADAAPLRATGTVHDLAIGINPAKNEKQQKEQPVKDVEKSVLLRNMRQRIKIFFTVDKPINEARVMTASKVHTDEEGYVEGRDVAAVLGNEKRANLISSLLKTLGVLGTEGFADGSLVKLQAIVARIRRAPKKDMNALVEEQTRRDPAVKMGANGGQEVDESKVRLVLNGASLPATVEA